MMNGPILPGSHVQKLRSTGNSNGLLAPPLSPADGPAVPMARAALSARCGSPPTRPAARLALVLDGAAGWGRGEPLGWLQGEDRGTGGCRGGHDLLAASGRGGAGTDGMNWRFLVTRLLVGRCPLRSVQYE